MFRSLPFPVALLLLFILASSSCKKDDFSDDPTLRLEFSQDTILFDTVFTTVGSATQVFTVYNTSKEAVRISSIRLATGATSNFRLNVDGLPGRSFSDVEIAGRDSIFIFVEVTVDPNNQNTPLVITDSILFVTNGNVQDIDLVAWGQDAYFHQPSSNSSSLFFLTCNETWMNDKPHVVYGYAMVDSGCVLTVNEGTQVHFHPGSGLIVLSSATLLVNGTTTNPVTFQGDRLGEAFKDIPGQWDRIWLSNITRSNLVNGSQEIGPGAKDCRITNAIIKNGSIGLLVDTVYASGQTTLRLENSIIKNMSSNGMILRGAGTKMYNSVIANCGGQNVALLYGGNYEFYHCTFANFWNNSARQDPIILLNNYFANNVRRLDAQFGNCIVFGNLGTELGIDSFPNAAPGLFNFRFDNTLLKVEGNFPTSNPVFYSSIIRNTNPKFRDIDNNNFELDSTSIAIDAGNPAFLSLDPVLTSDLNGVGRPQGAAPDLGAYERR